jgi:predicted lipid-binding transport protein (Tim44 family)
MKFQDLKNPRGKGIILGTVMAILLMGFHIPIAFAVMLGIIFGFMAFVVLYENPSGQ